jgi:hypothetical protein
MVKEAAQDQVAVEVKPMESRVDDVLSGVPAPLKVEVVNDDDDDVVETDNKPNKAEEKKNQEPDEKPRGDDSPADHTKGDSPDEDEGDGELDDYGQKVAKARVYTEEEVNRMMRDRAKRGHFKNEEPHISPPTTQQNGQSTTTAEPWEAELEKVIDQTITKREREPQQRAWQNEENERQAQFETKFTQGMEKYKDFREVVSTKPITDAMMIAVRGMDDPAAFLYAASKMQGSEIERIAKITDPFAQATELGRLEERMRKARATTGAARPLTPVKGDVGGKLPSNAPTIDNLINKHAKSKLKR